MDISRAVNAALLWGSKARVWPEVELGAGHPFDDHHDAGTGSAAHPGACVVSNPYYSPEASLRLSYGLEALNDEQFTRFSYCIQLLIDFLARRWRRSALRSLWFGLTRLSLVEFVPAFPADWFRWESPEGVLASHFPGEPQSWESLRNSAGSVSVEGIPAAIRGRPAFAIWFLLVYPRQFTPASAKLIEDALNGV
jgi:hypothetical protein